MAESKSTATNPLWGGRFTAGPAAIMAAINASVGFDRRLAREDLAASRVHARMLARQGVISAEDLAAILEGLDRIETEVEDGSFRFSPALEDVHMNIESRLADLVGAAAGRLHPTRSRNDQVAAGFRLWIRNRVDGMDRALRELQLAFVGQAEAGVDLPMPGFTHLQVAQPVTWGLHMLAYVEMLHRDRGRIRDARERLNECPLGAAALAGTSFPVDRAWVAAELGFRAPSGNALDAVSDRDFALESLSALAILAVHLSRFAEELVIWLSPGFGYARLSDSFTTGSSIMPQKRNPDAAELARAKTGRVIGSLISLLTVMKALPLAYSKDMQEDKEPVFDAFENMELVVAAMTGMVRDLRPASERLAAAAASGASTATDLADWLVRERGMPFRQAHRAVGALVQRMAPSETSNNAEATAADMAAISLDELRSVIPEATEDARAALSVMASIRSRDSFGGTAPVRVAERIRHWQEELQA